MRLCNILLENPISQQPQVFALLALMCFHTSRLDARMDESGEIIFYDEQNIDRWNQALIEKGIKLLGQSATGDQLTKYHLEAGIAYWNTRKEDTPEKWEQILQLYNQLLITEYSPIAALNRTYVLSKTGKLNEAIAEARSLNLVNNHLYYGLLGELYSTIDTILAIEFYRQSLLLAKTETDRKYVLRKINNLESL
jgi:RNA polymerase sigma-70 factor (ECF subfamily)